MIGINRAMSSFPSRVGDRAFCDHAHFLFTRQWQRQIDRFLVGDADGSLQRIERTALNRKMCRATVPAVTDVAGVTALARSLESVDHFTFSQCRFRAAVQLDKIDSVGS